MNLLTKSSYFLKTFVRITSISLLFISVFFLFNHFYSLDYPPLPFIFPLGRSPTSTNHSSIFLPSSHALPPPPEVSPAVPLISTVIERIGIVDGNGAMSVDFQAEGKLEDEEEKRESVEQEKETEVKVKVVQKFKVCDESMREYIPCLDNVEQIEQLRFKNRWEKYERHCPQPGKGLNCLVPAPKGYQNPIPWPQSRDEVWFSNVPHTRLVEDKGGRNWISVKKNKFFFPGGGTQFIHGADQYLNQISEMVPDIAFGRRTRVALDVGCGVASFGAYLLERNVTTLSIAPKNVHENQIQIALERGVPAMVAVFATRRLLYPSQAFDLIHCSRCRINWTRDDGILLLEVNRMLRAGGYFVWAAQPVYKHEENLQEQWKEMEDLTTRICWDLVKKEGYLAIWKKPSNNSCYLNRVEGAQPPLCDPDDDPDDVWYTGLKACITRLPDNGFGYNVTSWPARIHSPPDRLQSIELDAYMSRKELYRAESNFWNEIIDSYVRVFRWKNLNLRNVMDMRAGFGGFAAALYDLQVEAWIMNVVPVSGFNTLPVIFDRGLIGVMHDWCEAFDTYPRTYDLLHAAGLFSTEKKRAKCNTSVIMLEMDRILRPSGRVYIRDTVSSIDEAIEIAKAMGWTTVTYDTAEGPHASWKILICEKRL